MRITGVKAHLLTYTLKEPFEMRFALGKRTVLKRDAMLIEVGTDEGITGWGSGDPGDMGNRSWTPATVAAQIGEGIGAVLEGENPLAIDALWNKVRSESGLDAVQLTQLFGGVDMALWDIAGKAANRPVCDILGRRRNRIRAYASAGMYMPPSGYVAEARELAAAGFTAYKMRTATSPADDVEAAAAVRDALPGMALLVDAHSWWRAAPDIYTRDVIFGLARELDDLGLHWLEDPLDYRDTESYVDLTGSTRMRIGTGENEQGSGRSCSARRPEGVRYGHRRRAPARRHHELHRGCASCECRRARVRGAQLLRRDQPGRQCPHHHVGCKPGIVRAPHLRVRDLDRHVRQRARDVPDRSR